jgi:hypothetical protein
MGIGWSYGHEWESSKELQAGLDSIFKLRRVFVQRKDSFMEEAIPPPLKKPLNITALESLLPSIGTRNLTGITPRNSETRDIYNQFAKYILYHCERFSRLEDAPALKGIPFDFLGFKDERPYLIVFRDPIDLLAEPGETIKGRITRLIMMLPGLEAMLIQVSLRNGCYRLYRTENLRPKNDAFVDAWDNGGISPVVEWVQTIPLKTKA